MVTKGYGKDSKHYSEALLFFLKFTWMQQL